MNKITIFACILLNTISCYAAEFSLITLKPDIFAKDPIIEPALKKIYLNAFSTVYKDYWSEVRSSQLDFYTDTIERFKKESDMLLIVAQSNATIAGWALFHKNNNHEVCLEAICIEPAYWRHGLGKKLVFSVLEYWHDITTIAVETRTINAHSSQFYQSLGFKKTSIKVTEYDPRGVQGFEWVKNEN